MARELISSDGTFYYKLVLPSIFTLGFGFATFQVLSTAFADSNASGYIWIVPAVWVIGGAVLWGIGARLKTVWIEDDSFIVSRFGGEDTIPFGAVREVAGSRFISPPAIKILLDESAGCGGSIRFVPPMKLFQFPGQEHPMAAQLRERIRQQTGRAID